MLSFRIYRFSTQRARIVEAFKAVFVAFFIGQSIVAATASLRFTFPGARRDSVWSTTMADHRSFQESSFYALLNFRTENAFAFYEATDAYNVAEFPRVSTSTK